MFIGMFLIWTINIWPWLSTEGTVVLCHKAGQFSKNWEMLHSNPDSSFIWEQQQKQKAEDLATVGAASAETEQWTCLCICHSLHHSLMLTRPTFHSPTLWAWPLKASECVAPIASLSAVPGLQPVHSFSIIFMLNSLWPLPTVCVEGEVLTPHLPLRQESFAPWAATCLPSLCCFSFPSLLFATACILQSQNLSSSERNYFSLSKWNGGGGVTFCSTRVRSGSSTQNLNRSFRRLLLCCPGAEHS